MTVVSQSEQIIHALLGSLTSKESRIIFWHYFPVSSSSLLDYCNGNYCVLTLLDFLRGKIRFTSTVFRSLQENSIIFRMLSNSTLLIRKNKTYCNLTFWIIFPDFPCIVPQFFKWGNICFSILCNRPASIPLSHSANSGFILFSGF